MSILDTNINNGVSIEQMENKLKNYFVNVHEDKFTQFKTIISNARIALSEKLEQLPGKNKKFTLGMHYIHNNLHDGMFISLFNSNYDGDFIGLWDAKVFLLLDDKRRIQLSQISNHQADTLVHEGLGIEYREYVDIEVSVQDFITIANANIIEYSIRIDKKNIEGAFNHDEVMYIKGFYNNVFDKDFEVINLYNLIK